MFSLLPMSLWCSASTSDSQGRGSGFKCHFSQNFIFNSVELYRISLEKTRFKLVYGAECQTEKVDFMSAMHFWSGINSFKYIFNHWPNA